MSRFLSPRLQGIAPYTPGEQPKTGVLIKLNTNESPFPPSPKVLEALSTAEVAQLQLYSDPTCQRLESAIASRFALSDDQVISGNGSDELLAFAFQAFADPAHGLVYPDVTYGFYDALSALYGLPVKRLPLVDDFSVPVEDYFQRSEMIVLANPNAPTGIAMPIAQVEEILKQNPDRVVLVDEAYVDFGAVSAIPLIAQYENLLVVQTFSKSRSLAGMRIGFAAGQAPLIAAMKCVKFSYNPYTLDRLAILAGAAAVADEDYFLSCTRAIIDTRTWFAASLRAKGFTLTDSQANFVFAKHPSLSGIDYAKHLRDHGVLVRHFPGKRTGDYVRITIGTRAQHTTLLEVTP